MMLRAWLPSSIVERIQPSAGVVSRGIKPAIAIDEGGQAGPSSRGPHDSGPAESVRCLRPTMAYEGAAYLG